MKTFVPRDEEEIAQLVRAALGNAAPLDIIGSGSRRGLGRPSDAQTCISTSGLTGVIYYEPSELVLAAHSGTPLSLITRLLEQHDQELAFEPIDHGPLFGNPRGAGTIGGLFAVNASGPRRIKTGAARDHLLGFRAVSGRGEIFQSGGRVMKNVTGYDMSKLMTGSYGTFGIFSEVTLKVMPKAQTGLTLLIIGLDEEEAVRQMTQMSGLGYEISGFAHLPPLQSGFSSPAPQELAGKPLTALRLEGSETSVTARREELVSSLAAKGRRVEVLEAVNSRNFWEDLRDGTPFGGTKEQIWRISSAPANGALLVADLLARNVPVRCRYYDWAGGLIWLAVAAAGDAHAPAIHAVVDSHGGHATLIRASREVRAAVPVFHPQPPALAALTQRIRHSFDPELILNRGRIRDDL